MRCCCDYYIDSSLTLQGHYLATSPFVETVRCSEFKIMPLEGARGSKIPYNIDGDPVEAMAIHVKVLHQRLRVFCLCPDTAAGDVDVATATQSTA
jgi:diacylglycerol kinase family enzyme